jgi:hypothetical protein
MSWLRSLWLLEAQVWYTDCTGACLSKVSDMNKRQGKVNKRLGLNQDDGTPVARVCAGD